MSDFVTSAVTPVFHNIAPASAKIEDADIPRPERDLMKMEEEYIVQVLKMLNNRIADQASRSATMNDILKVVSALKEIELEGKKTIDPAVFNKQIALDQHSPAAASKPGEDPIASKSLWDVLLAYDICEEGAAKPVTIAQLKLLIDKAESSNESISSMSQVRAIELNRFVSSRDQAFSLNANLLRQLMEMMQAIIKQM
ncbi:MAG TPA: hypothetical protein VGM52_03140 [Herbaspirillum sp.]|jgi:hypothetical protein